MFRECDAAILNKIDLLPYLDYDAVEAVKNIRQIHPDMPIFEMSSQTKEGMAPWLDWLKQQVAKKQNA
jgi:hydrogenase nickel incorporation protein HypB